MVKNRGHLHFVLGVRQRRPPPDAKTTTIHDIRGKDGDTWSWFAMQFKPGLRFMNARIRATGET